jgi:hypothetical protein
VLWPGRHNRAAPPPLSQRVTVATRHSTPQFPHRRPGPTCNTRSRVAPVVADFHNVSNDVAQGRQLDSNLRSNHTRTRIHTQALGCAIVPLAIAG